MLVESRWHQKRELDVAAFDAAVVWGRFEGESPACRPDGASRLTEDVWPVRRRIHRIAERHEGGEEVEALWVPFVVPVNVHTFVIEQLELHRRHTHLWHSSKAEVQIDVIWDDEVDGARVNEVGGASADVIEARVHGLLVLQYDELEASQRWTHTFTHIARCRRQGGLLVFWLLRGCGPRSRRVNGLCCRGGLLGGCGGPCCCRCRRLWLLCGLGHGFVLRCLCLRSGDGLLTLSHCWAFRLCRGCGGCSCPCLGLISHMYLGRDWGVVVASGHGGRAV
mmetsp:Transcript_24444/g.60367  ORF Transcript_24444/g.60367 Transcript_24444/m.60367 type:complete len:279 (-) Transcript_24444:201-1037(-)